jgi:UDP-N-acetylglucosamine 4,6-dehydratase
MSGVHFVVHAAALKRIEVCESDPWEATLTNVIGTHHVASAAILAGVHRAVLLSTDKAPSAHTLYGATKFCAERLWLASNVYAAGHATKLAASRYGNVLNSRGSVVHLWREQAQRGEPLTVTDQRCTRFWLTLEQAVDLVLLALREMQGGEVYVPKCPSSPVAHLAATLSNGVGAKIVGLRPGERLHETLISSDESRTTYDRGSHYVIAPDSPSWGPYVSRGQLVDDGFVYRSDTNSQRVSVDELRALVAA